MTLGNLRTAVRERLDDPTFDTIKLDRWINWVIQDICSRADFPFKNTYTTFDTIVSDYDYLFSSIATDIEKVSSVLDTTNDIQLEYITPEEFDTVTLSATDNSKPYYWTVTDTELKLHPTPDGIYTIKVNYIKTINDLLNSTDIPVIPDKWSEIIILGAYQKALEWNDDFNYASVIEGQFERKLSRMISSSDKTSGQDQIIDWYRPEI